jgi:hypothetical protein
MLGLFLCLTASAPFIVFDKSTDDTSGKVGDPVTVLYTISNFGDVAVSDLHVDDSGIPLEQWRFPKSASGVRWSSLPPGANVTYAFEATPLIQGHLRMDSSRLRYLSEGEKKLAFSAKVIFFYAKASRSIGAKDNLWSYGIVVGASLASILVPFVIWLITRPKSAPVKVKPN